MNPATFCLELYSNKYMYIHANMYFAIDVWTNFVPPYQNDHAEILEINFCTVVFGGWSIILAEVYRYLTVLYLQRIILSYQSHTGLGVVERELNIWGSKPFILLLEKKIEKRMKSGTHRFQHLDDFFFKL